MAQNGLISLVSFIATTVLYSACQQYQQQKESRNRSHDGEEEEVSPSFMIPSSTTKEKVLEIRRKHYSKSVSVSYSNSGPLMIMRGKEAYLYDEKNNRYLDTRNNVAHCGHQNPRVVEAIQNQVQTLNTNSRYLHPNATILSQRLSKLLSSSSSKAPPLEVVFFVNSGSEANDLALRLARAYTKSKNTIVVDGAYHGHTIGTLEVSPYKFEHSKEFDVVAHDQESLQGESSKAAGTTRNRRTPGRHIWKVPAPDTYRGVHRVGKGEEEEEENAGEKYAQYVEEACDFFKTQKQEKVGSFITEGGMSVAGVILPPPSYLKRSVNAVRNAGGVYIADEVQTGFGRLGSCFWGFQYGNFSQEEDEIVPDIVTVGKPFGNGMPLAAVITTKKISEAFESMGVEYFNTFGGNPVCTAAGLAVLDEIVDLQLDQNALKVGGYLKAGFERLQESLDIIGDVRGSGFFLGIELVRNRRTLEPASVETSFLCSVLKEKYFILTSIDGPNDNVLVVKPPMVFSKENADEFLTSFEAAVKHDLRNADKKDMSKTPT